MANCKIWFNLHFYFKFAQLSSLPRHQAKAKDRMESSKQLQLSASQRQILTLTARSSQKALDEALVLEGQISPLSRLGGKAGEKAPKFVLPSRLIPKTVKRSSGQQPSSVRASNAKKIVMGAPHVASQDRPSKKKYISVSPMRQIATDQQQAFMQGPNHKTMVEYQNHLRHVGVVLGDHPGRHRDHLKDQVVKSLASKVITGQNTSSKRSLLAYKGATVLQKEKQQQVAVTKKQSSKLENETLYAKIKFQDMDQSDTKRTPIVGGAYAAKRQSIKTSGSDLQQFEQSLIKSGHVVLEGKSVVASPNSQEGHALVGEGTLEKTVVPEVHLGSRLKQNTSTTLQVNESVQSCTLPRVSESGEVAQVTITEEHPKEFESVLNTNPLSPANADEEQALKPRLLSQAEQESGPEELQGNLRVEITGTGHSSGQDKTVGIQNETQQVAASNDQQIYSSPNQLLNRQKVLKANGQNKSNITTSNAGVAASLAINATNTNTVSGLRKFSNDSRAIAAGFESTLKTNSTFSSNFVGSLPAVYPQQRFNESIEPNQASQKVSKLSKKQKQRNAKHHQTQRQVQTDQMSTFANLEQFAVAAESIIREKDQRIMVIHKRAAETRHQEQAYARKTYNLAQTATGLLQSEAGAAVSNHAGGNVTFSGQQQEFRQFRSIPAKQYEFNELACQTQFAGASGPSQPFSPFKSTIGGGVGLMGSHPAIRSKQQSAFETSAPNKGGLLEAPGGGIQVNGLTIVRDNRNQNPSHFLQQEDSVDRINPIQVQVSHKSGSKAAPSKTSNYQLAEGVRSSQVARQKRLRDQNKMKMRKNDTFGHIECGSTERSACDESAMGDMEDVFPGNRASQELRDEVWDAKDGRQSTISNSKHLDISSLRDSQRAKFDSEGGKAKEGVLAPGSFLNQRARQERNLKFVSYIRDQMMQEYGFDLNEEEKSFGKQPATSQGINGNKSQSRKVQDGQVQRTRQPVMSKLSTDNLHASQRSSHEQIRQASPAQKVNKMLQSNKPQRLNSELATKSSAKPKKQLSRKTSQLNANQKIGTLLESHKHLISFTNAGVPSNFLSKAPSKEAFRSHESLAALNSQNLGSEPNLQLKTHQNPSNHERNSQMVVDPKKFNLQTLQTYKAAPGSQLLLTSGQANPQGGTNFPQSTRHKADVKSELETLFPPQLAIENQFKETFMTIEPRLMRNLDSMENFSMPSPDLVKKINKEIQEQKASRGQIVRLPAVVGGGSATGSIAPCQDFDPSRSQQQRLSSNLYRYQQNAKGIKHTETTIAVKAKKQFSFPPTLIDHNGDDCDLGVINNAMSANTGHPFNTIQSPQPFNKPKNKFNKSILDQIVNGRASREASLKQPTRSLDRKFPPTAHLSQKGHEAGYGRNHAQLPSGGRTHDRDKSSETRASLMNAFVEKTMQSEPKSVAQSKHQPMAKTENTIMISESNQLLTKQQDSDPTSLFGNQVPLVNLKQATRRNQNLVKIGKVNKGALPKMKTSLKGGSTGQQQLLTQFSSESLSKIDSNDGDMTFASGNAFSNQIGSVLPTPPVMRPKRQKFNLDGLESFKKSWDSDQEIEGALVGLKQALEANQGKTRRQLKLAQTGQGHSSRPGFSPVRRVDGSESIQIEIMDQSSKRKQ